MKDNHLAIRILLQCVIVSRVATRATAMVVGALKVRFLVGKMMVLVIKYIDIDIEFLH